MENLFFELIMIALGHRKQMHRIPTAAEWNAIYNMSQRQSIVGVCFSGVERLPKEQLPPHNLLLNWFAQTERIERRNKLTNERCVTLCRRLHDEGYNACILKGQSVALYYPFPLRRQCGDIDVWVRTDKGSMEEDRANLIRYVRSRQPDAEVCYHHADFDCFDDVAVELHFMPTRLYCKPADQRLQAWIESEKNRQFTSVAELPEGSIPTVTDDFNAVFLFLHIAKHILEEGIGLRQLMDYYFLLAKPELSIDRTEFEKRLKSFGLYKAAQAVMYVMREVFGLPYDRLLCQPDEKRGRLIIKEIMISGNFGHYDPRFGDLKGETSLHRFVRKQTRVFRFFSLSPSETLWSPLFSIYQKMWRKKRGLL